MADFRNDWESQWRVEKVSKIKPINPARRVDFWFEYMGRLSELKKTRPKPGHRDRQKSFKEIMKELKKSP